MTSTSCPLNKVSISRCFSVVNGFHRHELLKVINVSAAITIAFLFCCSILCTTDCPLPAERKRASSVLVMRSCKVISSSYSLGSTSNGTSKIESISFLLGDVDHKTILRCITHEKNKLYFLLVILLYTSFQFAFLDYSYFVAYLFVLLAKRASWVNFLVVGYFLETHSRLLCVHVQHLQG